MEDVRIAEGCEERSYVSPGYLYTDELYDTCDALTATNGVGQEQKKR